MFVEPSVKKISFATESFALGIDAVKPSGTDDL